MSISFYKPNSKNTGCGFSFQLGVDKKTKEPTLYTKAIKQHSWNTETKTGYFSKNAKDPDKNIIVKFNEFECGAIMGSIRRREEYNTFHSFGEDKTIIKVSPWDKKAKKSYKDEDGSWKEKWVTVKAYSISFTRNGNQTFGIGIEPGEAEVIMEYLRYSLSELFNFRTKKNAENLLNQKNQETEVKPLEEREEAPF